MRKHSIVFKITTIVLLIAFTLSLMSGAVCSAAGDEYGTEEGGIDKNARSITPTETFMNGDFSEGLRYWGYYMEDGILSTLASMEEESGNRYVKITKPAGAEWKGIQSVPFKVEGLKNGDKIAVHFDYKTELEDPQFQVMLTSLNSTTKGETNNGGNVCDKSITTPEGWKGSLIPQFEVNGLEEGETALFQVDCRFRDGEGTYSTCFDNIQVFLIKDNTPEGCYETLQGGCVSSETLEEVKIYGPEESGYYGNGREKETEGFLNSDFSNGLLYWGTHYESDKYAMDNAKVVNENGNSYLEITTRENWKGIESAAFSLPGIENGDMLAVLVDYRLGEGASGYCADLNLVSGAAMPDSEGRDGAGRVENRYLKDGWESAISTFVQISDIKEGTAPRFTVTLRNSATDNKGPICFDNVRIVIKRDDIGDNCIETADGELLNRKTLWPYYGTKEKGMYIWNPDNNENTFKVITPESTDFFNFKDNGLKYWGALYFSWGGKAGYASDFAKAEEGNLVFGKDGIKTGEGIASAKIRLPEKLANKEWYVRFEYLNNSKGHVTFKTNDSEGHSANMNVNGDSWISGTCKLTYNEDCYFTLTAGADDAQVTIRNMALVFADEGGIPDTLVDVNGKPYNHEMGDANADGNVDIMDAIRAKKHSADDAVPVYIAALNFDGDYAVNASALTSLKSLLIEK